MWDASGVPGQDQSCAARTGVASCSDFVLNNGASFTEACKCQLPQSRCAQHLMRPLCRLGGQERQDLSKELITRFAVRFRPVLLLCRPTAHLRSWLHNAPARLPCPSFVGDRAHVAVRSPIVDRPQRTTGAARRAQTVRQLRTHCTTRTIGRNSIEDARPDPRQPPTPLTTSTTHLISHHCMASQSSAHNTRPRTERISGRTNGFFRWTIAERYSATFSGVICTIYRGRAEMPHAVLLLVLTPCLYHTVLVVVALLLQCTYRIVCLYLHNAVP